MKEEYSKEVKAMCWDELVSAHKFNNHPLVGNAINKARAKAVAMHRLHTAIKEHLEAAK